MRASVEVVGLLAALWLTACGGDETGVVVFEGQLAPELILAHLIGWQAKEELRKREDKSFKRGDAPAQRLLKAPGHGSAFAARP